MELTSILAKAEKGEQLSREDAVALLHTDNTFLPAYCSGERTVPQSVRK